MGDRTRLNLVVSVKVRENVESLGKRTGQNMSEVITRALAVYDAAVKNQQLGGKLVVRYPDGREKELVLVP